MSEPDLFHPSSTPVATLDVGAGIALPLGGPTTDVVRVPAGAAVAVPPQRELSEVGELVRLAITSGVDVDKLERLIALRERVEDRDAARAFGAALAAFQAECPPIAKTSTARDVSKEGAPKLYDFASLSQILTVAGPFLTKNGFSWSWDEEVMEKRIKVVCHLRHAAGHVQTATFTGPIPETTKFTNGLQAVATSIQYGKRYSLVSVAGLTTCDPDTDAREEETGELVTADQVVLLEGYIADAKVELPRFLKMAGAETLAEMLASKFNPAVAYLKRRIEEQKKGGAA